MAHFFLQYVYILFLLTFYVGVGDGRWRRTAKETLKYDIKLYRKLSEKINQELLTLYDDYPDDISLDYYGDEISELNGQARRKMGKEIDEKIQNNFKTVPNNESDSNPLITNKTLNISTNNKYSNHTVHKWPKFEDILIAMGKRYDWKNDRWIKLKKKILNEENNEINVKKNSVDFAEKHKFIYKIVKLNRAKSKRNIVIAVTAVR